MDVAKVSILLFKGATKMFPILILTGTPTK